ncbi:Protein-disulfide isomerase [Desulfonatronum zhilinae]|nr:Protein-disulfide isomerase [Desulfonatronum zhilinae]
MIKTLRLLFIVPALAFVFSCLAPQAADAQDMAGNIAPSEVRELFAAYPELVLDVLRDNPLELVEILEQAVMAKREADHRRQEQADLAVERTPEVSDQRPIRGNADAAVTIVEYSDFQCPYCSQATETVKRLMALDQAGELRLVFKHLPLNPVSQELALAFEAAALQSHDAAWKLHDRLFEQQGRLRGGAEAVLQEIVAELGIDSERFAEDRKRPELAELIQADMDEARKFGFSGTPMFLVNGIPLRGAVPLSEFQRVIELAKTRDSVGSN